MRVELAELEGGATTIDLPDGHSDIPPKVEIKQAAGLRGVLEREDESLDLSDVEAEELVFEGARLIFGTVHLRAAGPTKFFDTTLELHSHDEQFDMDMRAERITFPMLEISVGSVRVRAAVNFQDAALVLGEGRGRISASTASMRQFGLIIGELELRVPELGVRHIELGWGGPDGFWLNAETATGNVVELSQEAVSVHASDVTLKGFELRDGDNIAVLDALATRIDTEVALSSTPEPHTVPENAPRTRPIVDLRHLDSLAGLISCDVSVDVDLPGFLRRTAVHPIRLDVEAGTIGYPQLERSLSMLEELLFRFEHRGEFLSLELGLPWLHRWGGSKSLVRWALDESDQQLAQGERVRLSLLPQFELPSASTPPRASESGDDDKPSSVQLDSLELEFGETQLSLKPPARHFDSAIQYLAFEEARVDGRLGYRREAPLPIGHITTAIDALECRLEELATGEKSLSLHALTDRIDKLRVRTRGHHPHHVEVSATGLRLQRVSWM